MSTKVAVKDLLERNKKLAANHKPMALFSEIGDYGMAPPSILIVTCADPRCVPERFLGLEPMETVVFRNMCGHSGPEMNAILALDYFVNFSEVMIIHHTDCGASMFTDENVRESIKKRTSHDELDKMSFGTVTDIAQSVRDDLAVLRKSPLVRQELAQHSQGFVFDIKTGLIEKVEC